MPVLNVENAQIKTAAVEIKTLTVSGKQVTLAVFRQIMEEDIIDHENMKLNGTPWGLINYFWKEDYTDYKIHVLWQKGMELRRCITLKSPCNYNPCLSTHKYLELKEIMEEFKDDIINLRDKDQGYVTGSTIEECERIKPLEYFIRRNDSEIDNIKNGKSGYPLEEYEIYKIKALNKLCSLREDLNILLSDYNNTVNEKDNYINDYKKLILPLLDLPHLFIAV